MQLSDTQIERYSRQIILHDVGGRGQQRLLDASVTMVGHDPVLAVAAQYLVAAGVGRIDWVTTDDEAAACVTAIDALRRLNPDTHMSRHDRVWLDGDHACSVCLCSIGCDLARLNRLALLRRVTLLTGGIDAGGGCAAVYAGHLPTEACGECAPLVHREATRPGSAAATAAGLVGSVLAFEAIAACIDLGGVVRARSLRFDTETSTMTEQPISKRATCRACASAAER